METSPTIRLDLTKPLKPSEPLITHFNRILNEYPRDIKCYTDGSKSPTKTSVSFTMNSAIQSYRLPNLVSVSTAELTAIHECLTTLLQDDPIVNFFIMKDSLSSLLAIHDLSLIHI